MKLPRIAHTIVYAFCATLFLITPHTVFASISSCGATVDMDSVPAETTNTITFSVTNNTDNAEAGSWIKLTVPSGNFTFAGSPSSPGWSNSIDSSTMTMTGGSVDAGETYSFSIQVTSGNVTAGAANWGIQLSSDEGGADATSCSGSLGTSITGGGGDSSAPTISSLTVTDIGATSARIMWTTDEAATSIVQYGTTGDYGATKTDTSLTTSHSVTIDSLSALTTYHYSVQSTDAAGNTGDSGENTFVTNAASSTTTTTTTGTVRIVFASPTPTPIPDRVGPRISIKTKFEKIYTEPPEIVGTATDGSGVTTLEYSLDGGINFVPVDGIRAFGKTSIPFTFTPYQFDDGSYALVIRSLDGKGNTSTQKIGSYTVDRMPPQVGATIVTFGSQVIEPVGGNMHVVSGMEYVFTTSIIGGPVSVKYSVENSRGEVADMTAQKNIDTGLWRAAMRFDQAGTYTVFGVAIDGAANKTVTEVMQVSVLSGGVILDSNAKPIEHAEVTMFVLDNATAQFVQWDGKSYGQKNPFSTGKSGEYGFAVPSGKYYVRVKAFGYKTVISDIFDVNNISPIAQNIQMERAFGIQIGRWLLPLFDFSETRTVIRVAGLLNDTGGVKNAGVIGKEMQYFRFPFDGKFISSLDLRGKPTLITLLNTWSPITSPQISILDTLKTLSSVHTIVIVPQESTASVATFMKRGSYDVRIVADPDGILVDSVMYRTSPTHIFVDRKGIIKFVITGLVTKEEILEEIVK